MSSDTAALKKLVKQLQNLSTEEEITDLLRILKKDYQVNEAILRESKAGLAVGKLRSHASKQVSDLAKELVKKWKNEVERAKLGQGGSGAKGGQNGKPAAPGRKGSATATPSTPITPSSSSGLKTDARTAQSDGLQINVTSDKTRDKCIELIYDALASDSGAPADLILKRARGVEESVLSEFGSTSAAYKSKIRSLYVNLKDKNNPGLRANVVSGDLAVSRFANMTSQEMASEERKAADKKIEEENFHNSLGAEEQQAETDAFQCGRCKQWKCRYRQAQTRSADEPMTTFVTCTICNNRWKFS
ncbi:hypothetical protein PLICRDRAFT_179176 [Plicaturopsis crispa FD-325 SS-3]|uniref:Transcription elongation factor n=1 Tax=Plicaturopsis crispa FD-325 SS-3 TaxID=944288 RepID=A0A0C9T9B9_PLICR|nr:hypothetical protein PLICRDRAFT_179176 [Plicaturopsis crispa FD-325 SS-3]